ncbi:unnamed protein product [Kluyveromyces dobzhanskii CBS 2104]|uniref:WGS project CCBQ000000000 data, contig 00098 n=1 Tax=Kluyveromyces dobzhanskii CBS 2104 TaxID=1427455 RepID=A0A0A8L2Y8_9SACH|nr:unnamed protein product [Kluyveromyces dobzhanskii CBS 2104]
MIVNPTGIIIELLTWVKRAGHCFLKYWVLPLCVLSGAWNAFERTRAYDSGEIHGQMGGVWYRCFSTAFNHGSPIEENTIAGAINAVIGSVGPKWISKMYCIAMINDDRWHGTLLVGPDPSAMTATCSGAYRGTYYMGSGKLCSQWSHNNQHDS